MCISHKIPNTGAAGPRPCSENHCSKEKSMELVLIAISHSPVVANASKISLCYQPPLKNKPYQLQYKPASTKDISCLNLPYSPQPFLILFPQRDE